MFEYDWQDIYDGYWDYCYHGSAPGQIDAAIDEVNAVNIRKDGIRAHWYRCDKPIKDMESYELHNIKRWVENHMKGKRQRKAWLDVLQDAINYKAKSVFD